MKKLILHIEIYCDTERTVLLDDVEAIVLNALKPVVEPLRPLEFNTVIELQDFDPKRSH